MAYVAINTRTSADPNSSTDVNQLEINQANGPWSFTLRGNAVAGTNTLKFAAPFAGSITSFYAKVDTAPVGSALEFDLNKNGVSMLSSALSIAAAATTGTATPSTQTMAKYDLISIDTDQVGSTTPGGDNVYLVFEVSRSGA